VLVDERRDLPARTPTLQQNEGDASTRQPRHEAALLSNLLELYIHDLSEVFPERWRWALNGRFGYEQTLVVLVRAGTAVPVSHPIAEVA